MSCLKPSNTGMFFPIVDTCLFFECLTSCRVASWVLSSRCRRFCRQWCQFSPRPLCSSRTAKEALFEWEGETGLCTSLWSWGCAVWQRCCLCRPRWQPWLPGSGKKCSLLDYPLWIFPYHISCWYSPYWSSFLLVQVYDKTTDYKGVFFLLYQEKIKILSFILFRFEVCSCWYYCWHGACQHSAS